MRRIFLLCCCLLGLVLPVEAAESSPQYVALTFDAGPSGRFTGRLLDGLKELIRQTEPSEILVYGKTPPAMAALLREHSIPWQAFPHNMATRVRAREEAQ